MPPSPVVVERARPARAEADAGLGVARQRAERHAADGDRDLQPQRPLREPRAEHRLGVAALAVALERHPRQRARRNVRSSKFGTGRVVDMPRYRYRPSSALSWMSWMTSGVQTAWWWSHRRASIASRSGSHRLPPDRELASIEVVQLAARAELRPGALRAEAVRLAQRRRAAPRPSAVSSFSTQSEPGAPRSPPTKMSPAYMESPMPASTSPQITSTPFWYMKPLM